MSSVRRFIRLPPMMQPSFPGLSLEIRGIYFHVPEIKQHTVLPMGAKNADSPRLKKARHVI
jgi:hypothetical protein